MQNSRCKVFEIGNNICLKLHLSTQDSFGTIPNSVSILFTTARKAASVMGQPWTRSSTVTISSSFFTFSP